MRREYPTAPIPGVGALIIRDGLVLLVKRGHEPGKGLWSIPGGVVELGETVHQAVVREVKEETGLDVEVERLLEVGDVIVNDEAGNVKYHYVMINFLVRVVGGVVKATSDASNVRWFPINRLSGESVTKTTRRLLGMVVTHAS